MSICVLYDKNINLIVFFKFVIVLCNFIELFCICHSYQRNTNVHAVNIYLKYKMSDPQQNCLPLIIV